MRYLILAADYLQPTLRDDDPDSDLDLLQELSAELKLDIAEWNEGYQVIIPMDPDARSAAADLISTLDLRGLALAARIEKELRSVKVRYFSEGLLKPLR